MRTRIKSEIHSGLFVLSNFLGPPSLNSFVRLFPSIYNCSLSEFFFFYKGVNQWIFNPSSRKFDCLNFTGIYFHPIFYRPFLQSVKILLQLFYVVFICDLLTYYTVVSEESNIRVDVAPNIIYLHYKE
jgi:hypothetical protein